MTNTISLIPTIIQDAITKQVLMLGYSNSKSLAKMRATGRVWFYSRSQERLWEKGETSKNYLKVVEIVEDCDRDAILITAQPEGPTCHTGAVSCFSTSGAQTYTSYMSVTTVLNLESVIQDRKQTLPKGSYTVQLLRTGTKAICNKITEEAIEVTQAARFESKQRLAEEVSDLLYHLFVLLADRELSLADIVKVLHSRQRSKNTHK